jgi:tRNA1(Val) A37 N6-methylase TrmN6
LHVASKRYKTKGVGIDIDKKAVEMSRSNVDAEKLANKIQIFEGDFTLFDVSKADVRVLLFALTVYFFK